MKGFDEEFLEGAREEGSEGGREGGRDRWELEWEGGGWVGEESVLDSRVGDGDGKGDGDGDDGRLDVFVLN